jgi:hypothetical protein
MKKTVKIGFVNFWGSFDREAFICTRALRERYNVEVMPDANDADYVFFSVFGDEHFFLSPDKIKIFYTGENFAPDFNACDYAIGFEWLTLGDRYLRMPNYYVAPEPHQYDALSKVGNRNRDTFSPEELHCLAHRNFCSFVVSNANGNPIRRQLFELLSQYKKVDSGGRWMNNVGGPVSDKIAFESAHKFAITCENSSHSGYSTEKIIETFAANVVPIYWGDPDICKVFNPKAFINVLDYPSLDAVVQKVIEIDADENAYTAMLKEPPLLQPNGFSIQAQMAVMCDFMSHIIEQPLEKAQRYNRDFWGKQYCEREKSLRKGRILIKNLSQKLNLSKFIVLAGRIRK